MAALVKRERPQGPRLWILVWLVALFLSDCVAWWLGINHQNNRWLSYVSTPIQALAVLWAMML